MSGLRVRDIILFTDEFDPRVIVEPSAFPKEQDVWMSTLTGEEFKTFWNVERVALQWQIMAESGFRHIPLKKESANDLLPIHTKIPGSVGCPAEIRMRKLRDRDAVEVEYHWRHNHDDSAKARSKMPLSGIELEWVKKMAADGLDWKSIKARLRLDSWSLRQ
ncbi:hypothetical protein BGX30_005428, partial [Mortierella sp. GBA39]